MKTKLFLFFLLSSTLLLNAQPANDTCANAQNITVTTTFQVVTFDLINATINNELGCSGDPLDDYVDVWYQFVMPITGKLYINGSISTNKFKIYDSCNGTELDCFNTYKYVEGLVEGNTYILRVFRRQSQNIENFQEFYLYALPLLTNDTCSNSANIVVDNTLQTINFNIIEADINNEVGCEGESTQNYRDIWYNFTMPVNGSLEISGGSINRFAIYDSCNGTQIACFNGDGDMATHLDDLTQNENYTLRIFRSNINNSNSQYFTIKAIVPTYPTCQNIQPLSVSTTSQTINLDLSSANYSYEYGCEEEADSYTDFWYEFTMPINGNIYLNPTAYSNAAIYDSCGGSLISCFSEGHLVDDLVQGQTYILRIFRAQSTSDSFGKQFTIQAFERLTNDDCANAETLPTLTRDNTGIHFYLAGATVNTEDTCAGMTDTIVDAWWQFTMPITGNLFIDTPDGNGIAVYDTCNGNELFCNASQGSLDSFKLIDGLTEGETYLIRCFNTEESLNMYNFQTLNLRVYERAANDECANAEVIPTITATPQEVAFDTFGSLINFEVGCVGQPEENFVDVWFEFTMPDFPYLSFESYPFNFFTIFDTCNGNELYCSAGNDVAEGLVPNQTYLLRVFQRQSLDMFHPYKSFNIFGTNTLGINEIVSQNKQLKMQDNQTISITNLQSKATLYLYNMLGQEVLNIKLMPATSQQVVLNVPTGIYIARLNNRTQIETLKLVVKH